MNLGLIVLAGCASALIIVTQSSAGASATLSVGSATIAPGDEATVTVRTSVPSPGLGAWTVDVNVQDPDQVSIVDCTAESHSVCNPDFDASLPTARFAGANATGLVGTTVLGTVTVRCASTEGSSVLGLDTVGFADPTIGGPVEIPVTFSPGTIRCDRAAATATRAASDATSTASVGGTPTTTVGGLPPAGGGSREDAPLPVLIVALAGLGIAGVVGYQAFRLRARRVT